MTALNGHYWTPTGVVSYTAQQIAARLAYVNESDITAADVESVLLPLQYRFGYKRYMWPDAEQQGEIRLQSKARRSIYSNNLRTAMSTAVTHVSNELWMTEAGRELIRLDPTTGAVVVCPHTLDADGLRALLVAGREALAFIEAASSPNGSEREAMRP